MTTVAWPAGLITALVTPLRGDDIDLNVLGDLLERQIDAGVAAVLAGGGTGEFGALSVDERLVLTEAVADRLDGRLPFLVQTGALATRDSIRLGKHAEEAGACGLMVASPFGEPISWLERRAFYEDVHEATSLPIMIYNTPPSGLLSLEQIQELAALPRATAVKDSSGDVTLLGDLIAWSRTSDFAVYVGLDSLIAFAGMAGARGCLFGTGNIVPSELVRTFNLTSSQDGDGELNQTWPALHSFLRFVETSSNYVALCKAALQHEGLEVGDVRRPYIMPADAERTEMVRRLDAVKQAFASASPAQMSL